MAAAGKVGSLQRRATTACSQGAFHEETLHRLALLYHDHTDILWTLLYTLVKYLPLQIKEYENKPTWLPLEKAGSSNDARQQRAVKESPIKETLHILGLLCHNHPEIVRILINTLLKYSPFIYKQQNMKINLRGCRWERSVTPTTRDNSVQSRSLL